MCRAKRGNCPYGGADGSFDTKSEALAAVEVKKQNQSELAKFNGNPNATDYNSKDFDKLMDNYPTKKADLLSKNHVYSKEVIYGQTFYSRINIDEDGQVSSRSVGDKMPEDADLVYQREPYRGNSITTNILKKNGNITPSEAVLLTQDLGNLKAANDNKNPELIRYDSKANTVTVYGEKEDISGHKDIPKPSEVYTAPANYNMTKRDVARTNKERKRLQKIVPEDKIKLDSEHTSGRGGHGVTDYQFKITENSDKITPREAYILVFGGNDPAGGQCFYDPESGIGRLTSWDSDY